MYRVFLTTCRIINSQFEEGLKNISPSNKKLIFLEYKQKLSYVRFTKYNLELTHMFTRIVYGIHFRKI